jgi:hypothetical protein
MSRDDIIRMAQEIAAEYSKAERFQTWTHDFMMQRLMELVAVSAAAQRKPLTDEQILALWEDTYVQRGRTGIEFARAIEAAHGIKE